MYIIEYQNSKIKGNGLPIVFHHDYKTKNDYYKFLIEYRNLDEDYKEDTILIYNYKNELRDFCKKHGLKKEWSRFKREANKIVKGV